MAAQMLIPGFNQEDKLTQSQKEEIREIIEDALMRERTEKARKKIYDINADRPEIFDTDNKMLIDMARFNVSRKEICEFLGISATTMGRWINGEVEPHLIMRTVIKKITDIKANAAWRKKK